MSVNISRRQLIDTEIVEDVQRILGETRLDPQRLSLEVTESVIMEDIVAILETLRQIKAMDVHVHMDDFGTGQSSLAHLHDLPADALRIDQSFIRNMGLQVEYSAIVHAVVTLAHNLGITVVAEGLETAEQLAQLQALDCDLGQGYCFARPMDPDQAQGFLEQRHFFAKSA